MLKEPLTPPAHHLAAGVQTSGDLIVRQPCGGESEEEIRAEFDEVAAGVLLCSNAPPEMRKAAFAQFTSAWMRYFRQYDPGLALARLQVPTLAVYGDKDVQVLAGLNVPAVRSALKQANTAGAPVEVPPSHNHLLQRCETGAVTEYARIEETMSPAALELIGNWIRERSVPENRLIHDRSRRARWPDD